jgi:hypothetical protein
MKIQSLNLVKSINELIDWEGNILAELSGQIEGYVLEDCKNIDSLYYFIISLLFKEDLDKSYVKFISYDLKFVITNTLLTLILELYDNNNLIIKHNSELQVTIILIKNKNNEIIQEITIYDQEIKENLLLDLEIILSNLIK